MDDKTELALTRWFNSFSGDHGKSEWESLVEIVNAALTRERKTAVAAEREACAAIAIACDEEDERANGAAMTGAAAAVLEEIHART